MLRLLAHSTEFVQQLTKCSFLSLTRRRVPYWFSTFPVEDELCNRKVKRPKNPKAKCPVIEVWEGMTVKELALAAQRQPNVVLSTLNYGMLTNGTAAFDTKIEDRSLLVSLVNLMGLRPLFKVQTQRSQGDRDAYPRPPARPDECVPRPAVVAILGHVDHGKTTLLDSLRASRMVDEEYGGITQHLAAFTVSLASVAAQTGSKDPIYSLPSSLTDYITFLDTPGHAAFSAIRARGASATDIILLVVAADDSVMPQTVESIQFAKEADAAIIVAINKVDKREADVGRVINDLAINGVVVEQLGGDVQSVEISALKRTNLHSLLEAICLQAEIMQLCADPNGPAEGFVLESKMEHGIGKVATCLVTRGQLRKTPSSGPLVAGEAICSPRIIFNDRGQQVTSVSPGFVAKVAGWKELPPAGATFLELHSQSKATDVVRFRQSVRMEQKAAEDHSAYLARMAPYQTEYDAFIRQRDQLHRSQRAKTKKSRPDLAQLTCSENADLVTLHLLIKADVQGSLEAIRTLLSTCPSTECTIESGLSTVGPLTESEVANAKALGATILLFNVPPLPAAAKLAETEGVQIIHHNIIYRLAEDVRDMITQRLSPMVVERIIGEAEILALFDIKEPRSSGKPLVVPVAGCRCIKGHLVSNPNSVPTTTITGDIVSIHYRIIRPSKVNTKTTTSSVLSSISSEHAYTSDGAPPGTVVINRASCRSMRHEKTTVDCIRKGVECGLSLTTSEQMLAPKAADKKVKVYPSNSFSENFVSNWEVGDLIQCFAVVHEPRKSQWKF